ncbi:glycosyltransferase family 4 protein [Pseudoxanthomonas suwonensis]|uniref:glycosyltransferase family 4 protein n=1 Tax=Pseudoxanthomonas suwonensis TaxID=314722 RepID=UPI0009DDB298
MKILFLTTYDDPRDGGGAELTIWTLIRTLVEHGHQCVVLSTHAGRGLVRLERDGVHIWRAGIRNFYWPTKEKPASQWAKLAWHAVDSYSSLMQGHLREVLFAEQPDVVSVHSLPGWSAASWETIRLSGTPFVQVLHDQYSICARSSMFRGDHNCKKQCIDCKLLRLPHRGTSNYPTAVVGVSRYILDHHLAQGYFREVPVKRVIHNTRNPVHLDVHRTAEPHLGVRFGFIGRLDPSKGIEVLLDAFFRFKHSESELWIGGVGDSAYVDRLKRRTEDPRVRFLGRVRPQDFYPEVDAVVVPSLWNDTFPGVVFEGLAYGKPVLGARRGGIPEMIQHGVNGFLFDPENADELVGVLASIAQNCDVRRSMSDAARASSEPFLDTDAWLRSYLDLYKEISAFTKSRARRHDLFDT